MCRNIFALQQTLTNITMAREIALDHARQYFELFYHTPEVSLLWVRPTEPPKWSPSCDNRLTGVYLFYIWGIVIDSWEQWWAEDWHGKTKTPEQVCIPATYNINSTIIINTKIIFLDTRKYVSFHWWSCMFGLYINFSTIAEMHFALFFIVQLCTQFPVRESGGAGLL